MSYNQKTPYSLSINQFVDGKIDELKQSQGIALPCYVTKVEGQIVTVNFSVSAPDFNLPSVQCPIIGAEYIRMPTQIGDKGFCISADARLGGITGLGEGLAPLGVPSNFGALVFVPIGNLNWTTVDPNAVTIYGPNGVVLRDTGSQTTFTLTPSGLTINSGGTIKLQVGGNSITISSSGVDLEGTVTINGRNFLLHEHSGVQPGTGNSGGVV